MERLLKKKMLFLTGKGGTGKTSLAAALAMYAARGGKRCLLLEVDMTRPSMDDIFNSHLKAEPGTVAPGIDAVNVRFEDCLRRFLKKHVQLDMVAGALLKNKTVRLFLESTPFAREIAFLEEFKRWFDASTSLGYDLIIVDLPATGHALPLLTVSSSMAEMFGVGPMLRISEEFRQFLANHRQVSLLLVTLPEELPVTETLELHQRLKNDSPVECETILVNRVPSAHQLTPQLAAVFEELPIEDAQLSPRLSAYLESGRRVVRSRERVQVQLGRLKPLGASLMLLPEIEWTGSASAARALSTRLEELK